MQAEVSTSKGEKDNCLPRPPASAETPAVMQSQEARRSACNLNVDGIPSPSASRPTTTPASPVPHTSHPDTLDSAVPGARPGLELHRLVCACTVAH